MSMRVAGKVVIAAGMAVLLSALFTGMPRSVAQDAEPPRTLAPGKGVELASARCMLCHDAQHITRIRLSRDEWEHNIRIMITRGAPVTPDEIRPILDYLTTYYGRDPAPAATAGADSAGAVDPVQRLLISNACIACHSVEQKMVGPTFREIARRYSGTTGAAATLARKIRDGGAGTWGSVPMPPHGQISDTDLQQIAAWVLAQQ